MEGTQIAPGFPTEFLSGRYREVADSIYIGVVDELRDHTEAG